MKQILLSADGPVYLCLVPDIVEKNLRSYIEEFYDYVYEFKRVKIDEYHYQILVDEIIGFIDWLNEKFEEKSSVISILNNDELDKYNHLSWWNW